VVSDNVKESDTVEVSFYIDPSVSGVKDENLKLAKYMMHKLVNIDIYDAES
jgi:hypothetical protein